MRCCRNGRGSRERQAHHARGVVLLDDARPSRGVASGAVEDRVSRQAEHGGRSTRGASVDRRHPAGRCGSFRNAGTIGDALRHHAKANDLDRPYSARTEARVLLPRRLRRARSAFQRRSAAQGMGTVIRTIGPDTGSPADDAGDRRAESLLCRRAAPGRRTRFDRRVARPVGSASHDRDGASPDVVMLGRRVEQAERREQAGRRRHDDASHLELLRNLARRRTVCLRTRKRILRGIRGRASRPPDHAHHVEAAITCAPCAASTSGIRCGARPLSSKIFVRARPRSA